MFVEGAELGGEGREAALVGCDGGLGEWLVCFHMSKALVVVWICGKGVV